MAYGAVNVPLGLATPQIPGLMSGGDKAKLDGASFPAIIRDTAMASFTSAAAGRPLHVKASIQAVQAGSGDPSPANPRAINGWTGAGITVSPNAQGTGGTTYTFTFPASAGTVYGGTLNTSHGVLTVTYKSAIISSLGGGAAVAGYNYYKHISVAADDGVNWGNAFSLSDIACTITSMDDLTTKNPPVAYYFGSGLQKLSMYFRNDISDGTAASVNTWLAQNPVKIVYKLASPVTYPLTPRLISTLSGTNNVFADCGPVTVTHWPGTGTPVAPVEDGAEIAYRLEIVRQLEELRNAILAMGGNL